MGGSAAEAAATLTGKIKRNKIAVDEAKESVGAWINEGLALAITEIEFLDATMAGATKGNELFALGIVGVRGHLEDATDDVAALAGGLIFAADHGVVPTTEALLEQATQLGLTEGETRELADRIQQLADDNKITQGDADLLTAALDTQADSMSRSGRTAASSPSATNFSPTTPKPPG